MDQDLAGKVLHTWLCIGCGWDDRCTWISTVDNLDACAAVFDS